MRTGVNIDIKPPTPIGQGMVDSLRGLNERIRFNDADAANLKVCLSTFHGHVLKLGCRSANFRARLEVPTGDVCDTRYNYSGPVVCAAQFQYDATCFIAGRVMFTPNIPPRVWDDYPTWDYCMGRRPAALNIGEWTRCVASVHLQNHYSCETDIPSHLRFAKKPIYSRFPVFLKLPTSIALLSRGLLKQLMFVRSYIQAWLVQDPD